MYAKHLFKVLKDINRARNVLEEGLEKLPDSE